MNKDLSQIEFYFPKGSFNNKEEIVDQIISFMKEKGSTLFWLCRFRFA